MRFFSLGDAKVVHGGDSIMLRHCYYCTEQKGQNKNGGEGGLPLTSSRWFRPGVRGTDLRDVRLQGAGSAGKVAYQEAEAKIL